MVRRLVYAHKACDRATEYRATHRADERRLVAEPKRSVASTCCHVSASRFAEIDAGPARDRSALAIHRPRFMRINVAARYDVTLMLIGSMPHLPCCVSDQGGQDRARAQACPAVLPHGWPPRSPQSLCAQTLPIAGTTSTTVTRKGSALRSRQHPLHVPTTRVVMTQPSCRSSTSADINHAIRSRHRSSRVRLCA